MTRRYRLVLIRVFGTFQESTECLKVKELASSRKDRRDMDEETTLSNVDDKRPFVPPSVWIRLISRLNLLG